MDKVKEHIEMLLDAKLAAHADDVLRRVNGTYMRGREQQLINEGVTTRLAKIDTTLEKMHLDLGHMTTAIGRFEIKSAGR